MRKPCPRIGVPIAAMGLVVLASAGWCAETVPAGGPVGSATAQPPGTIDLGGQVRLRNVEDPFDYFTNSWTVIGLKDHVDGIRISPTGELLLADGLICRPLIGKAMVPLNRRLKKTLEKGYLPIVRWQFVVNDEVRYTIEALACPLGPRWQEDYGWPTGDNFQALLRVTFANLKKAATQAGFGLEWAPKAGKVECRAKESAGAKNRFSVLAGGAQLCLVELPDHARLAVQGARVEVTAELGEGESSSIIVRIPFRSLRGPATSPATAPAGAGGADLAPTQADFDTWAGRTRAFWEGLLARGAKLEVPEAEVMNCYRASLVYQFIGRDKGEVHAGEGFYDELFLRDGAYQVTSLAQAGYLDEARRSLEPFLRFQNKEGFFCTQGGQLDGHGYAIWALAEHYRLTRDADWLGRVWPAIERAARWIQQARRKEKDPSSPFFGILPAAPADGENLWDGKHHILGYDWWCLRGLQSAAEAARALGKEADAAAFAKEFDEYRGCILRALDRTGLPYIPPSYEKDGTHWGNLEVIFPSPLLEEQDKRVGATLDFVRNRFGAVDGEGGGFREGVIQWSPPKSGAIHPYMSQFVTNSHIIRGERDEAVDGFYSFLLHTTSTWGFPEGVYWKRRQAWANTVPHLWAAALYVTTLRNMLVREYGDCLHLLSAVPGHWLDEGKQVRVADLPTHFGKVGLLVVGGKDQVRVEITPPPRPPAGGVVIHMPSGIEAVAAKIADMPLRVVDRQTVLLPAGQAAKPCTVTVQVRRTAKGPSATFQSKVAAYLAENAPFQRPIPGLAPAPGKVAESDCVKLDLSALANTNPLTAPFNIPNVGKYVFAGLPLGHQVVAGIPFHILDPARNAGKGLVVLNGDSACVEFPSQVKVPCQGRGRLLCVLGNVTGWAQDDPGTGKWGAVGEYEIQYADGTAQRVPIITGRTADDWAQPPDATDVTVALRGEVWHLNLLVIALEPKPIAAVVIRDTGTPASPVVAAMTLIK